MSSPPLLNGPIPPYNNPAIEPQYYQPRQYFISTIALGVITTVTTTEDHDYVIGQECRLLIPNGYGCRELDEETGYVISIPASDQVVLNINSQNATAFIAVDLAQSPQIVAIGEINTGAINSSGRSPMQTYINGSFINISPL